MDNYSNIGIAAAAGQMGQRAIPVTTSLEQRLDHLTRGVERLCKVRNALEDIAARLASNHFPTPGETGQACPPSSDLSGRFGDAIGHVHANIDGIESLVNRIRLALFDEKNVACDARRA